MPSAVVMRLTRRVSAKRPPAAKVAYAFTSSTSRTSLAPSASEGFASRSEVMPSERAKAITCCSPTRCRSETATGLIERASAIRSRTGESESSESGARRTTVPRSIGSWLISVAGVTARVRSASA